MKIDDRQTVSIAVREILNTREVRQGLSFLVPELLRIWADKSHLKNKITGPLERLVVSGISPDTPGQYPSLFADPGAVRQLSTALPQVLAAAVVAYAFGHAGMMLSPVHVCLVVTNEHFGSRLWRSIRGLFAPALVVMVVSILCRAAILAFP